MDKCATFPGPVNGSVLYEQEKHVSSAVWESQERGALRCHEHTSKLDQWILTPKQIELVEAAGFGYLRLIPAISLDNPLISALVERWRRETNTFHLTVGEMTVTLTDVALLLGLSIEGEAVIGETCTSCTSVCARFLGKVPEPGYASGGMVKLSWLKENFSRCPDAASIEEIEHHTRAYLLYLIGSTIFSTTTGNKVPVMYVPLFKDFDSAGKYAWGAAALAFLYRALGNASLKTQSTISGCLTLLQCWSYYHLNVGRPKFIQEPDQEYFPFVLRWKGKQSCRTTKRDVVFYREVLDSLNPCDVEWLPYRNLDSSVIPDEIKDSLVLGRSKTMLICFDKAERHLPDRCLRQYGMLQPIPEDVQPWERKTRGVDGGVDLSGKMESEIYEWVNHRNYIVEDGNEVEESVYMQWYSDITRKFVGRPISLSSEFQKSNASLREIADLANTFPTEGLDPQQIESISMIRYIAHECLRGQVGSPTIASATPQMELGKPVRDKEKVRRKNGAKRKRKGDPIDSEDDPSQFFHITAKIDPSDLCNEDGTVDHSQFFLLTNEGDNMEICNEDFKVDQSQLCHTTSEADNGQPLHVNGEVKHSEPCHTANEDDSTQPGHADNGITQLPHNASNGANISVIHVGASEFNSRATCENDLHASQMTVEVIPRSSNETGDEIEQHNEYMIVLKDENITI